MIIAIIPARGGSKRLPRKNLRMFSGHPLIAYSIAAGRASKLIQRVFVTTEDKEIADIAATYGAEVIGRPHELAGDTVKTGTVIQHALEQIASVGQQPEAVVLLQPTNMLRNVALVDSAIHMFLENEVDSVLTVSVNSRKIGRIIDGLFQPEYTPETRSQDLAPSYYENGLVYVTKTSVAISGRVFGTKMLPLVVDELYAVADIDTELDFQIAEFVYQTHRDRFISV